MESIVELNANNWDKEVSKSETLTVVYFWASTMPVVHETEPNIRRDHNRKYWKNKICKIEHLRKPTNQEIASNLAVMSTPTLMLFCSGRPISQIVGQMSKEELKKILGDMLRRCKTCVKQSSDPRSYIA